MKPTRPVDFVKGRAYIQRYSFGGQIFPHPTRCGFFFGSRDVMIDGMIMQDPNYLVITGLLKATPQLDAGQRFLYMEVSNEKIDAAGERVLAEALKTAATGYERGGNVDIDHITMIGQKMGIPDYLTYEVGSPVNVHIDGTRSFVKAVIYQGDGRMAEKANMLWESITQLNPPKVWYPSIGGAIKDCSVEFDPDAQCSVKVIRDVFWTNVGLSRTPVNQAVPAVAALPFGTFAKCWLPALQKSDGLVAGQQYDIAGQPGGHALRTQSMDPRVQSYWDLRQQFSRDISAQRVAVSQDTPSIIDYVSKNYQMSEDDASRFVQRFLRDLRRHLKMRTAAH